ncbi:hypothetical protein [Bradyrhizobium sp. Tv2a-2]|uniref:hypothetical protein n=1 Tax=Bradyrhizobium sp. Tv2a-2 TaxID=113395 RepID=UPI000401209C|nr:hypothetical protein [Bradyrhizobium sp. Tv2a-2]
MADTIYSNTHGGWIAMYTDRLGVWRIARDARGLPIACDTAELARSVANCRRQRLTIWN